MRKFTPLFAVLAVLAVGGILVFSVSLVIGRVRSPVGTTYYVGPEGDDGRTGQDKRQPLATIQKALNLAQPGDRVELLDGEYHQSFHSDRDGSKKAPITLAGSSRAVVKGDDASNRVIEINHDYLHLEGFRIDGRVGDTGTKKDYRDKLIYIQGIQKNKGVTGLKLSRLTIENAGGECVRLRYFAVENEIADNTIRGCGAYDFQLADGGKNGEAIYIGTAPEQRKDGRNPTTGPDRSARNWVHHNRIDTRGNECVDIKEGATENVVEHNSCSGQRDPNSAGLDSRGERNIFRYNTVRDSRGAGVRLGGDDENDGIDNQVYGNRLINNQGGAVRVMRLPQGKICENVVEDEPPAKDLDEETSVVDPTAACDA